jgi:tetratricopeptide (TPR) repeat protein
MREKIVEQLIEQANDLLDEYKLEEALDYCTEAIKIDTHEPEAYFKRGFIHNEMKNFYQAKEDWVKALLLAPDDAHAAFNIGLACDRLEEYDESVFYYTLAVEIDHEYGDGYILLANTLSYINRGEEAALYYEKALENDTTYDDVWYGMGKAFLKTG